MSNSLALIQQVFHTLAIHTIYLFHHHLSYFVIELKSPFIAAKEDAKMPLQYDHHAPTTGARNLLEYQAMPQTCRLSSELFIASLAVFSWL